MEAAAALCSLSCLPALTHFPFSNRSSSKPYYPTIPSLLRPFSSSISASTPSSAATSPPSWKKVTIPIGFGTEEMEAVVMIDVSRGLPLSPSCKSRLPCGASMGFYGVLITSSSWQKHLDKTTFVLVSVISLLCQLYGQMFVGIFIVYWIFNYKRQACNK